MQHATLIKAIGTRRQAGSRGVLLHRYEPLSRKGDTYRMRFDDGHTELVFADEIRIDHRSHGCLVNALIGTLVLVLFAIASTLDYDDAQLASAAQTTTAQAAP